MRLDKASLLFASLWGMVMRLAKIKGACANKDAKIYVNLVPRAHVPFGQHQDTELWNNQFPETKILGLSVLRRIHASVYKASRDKVDVDAF